MPFHCNQTLKSLDANLQGPNVKEFRLAEEILVILSSSNGSEDIKRPSIRKQQMMTWPRQPGLIRLYTHVSPRPVVGMEFLQSGQETGNILGSTAVHDIKVKGRDRGAMKDRADSANDDIFNVMLAKNLKNSEEISRRLWHGEVS